MTVTFAEKLARMPHYEAGMHLADARATYETDDVVKLASNECPWPPHPAVLEAIAAEAAGVHRYPDQHARLASKIVQNVLRVERMITDLLDANRVRGGEPLKLNLAQCELDRIAREVADEMMVANSAPHQAMICVEADECTGFWDESALRRVLENLLSNAIKYGTAGTPITAKLTQDKSIDYVVTLGAPFALTAVQSASDAGSKAKIATFDLNKDLTGAISKGTIEFAVDQQPYLQGYESIDNLWLYLTNGNILGGGQTVLTGPSFIDQSNIKAVAEYAKRGTR